MSERWKDKLGKRDINRQLEYNIWKHSVLDPWIKNISPAMFYGLKHEDIFPDDRKPETNLDRGIKLSKLERIIFVKQETAWPQERN